MSTDIVRWSPLLQAKRRHEQAALIRSRLRPLLDDDARSDRLAWWDQGRVAIWASNAFFIGETADIAFANTILRYFRDALPHPDCPNVFDAAALAGVIAQHGDRMEPDVRDFCQAELAHILPHGCTRDFQFHGFNDNMPVMWSWALIFGGDLLGERRCSEIGRANLCQLRDLFRRRGAVSEYGQNYGTHRLTGLAHLVDYAADPEVRALARDLEARVWAELAGIWHPTLGQMGGPANRGGYPLIGETTALLRQVFGDDIAVSANPWHAYFIPDIDADGFTFAYPFAYGAEFAAATYHVPDAVAELFYAKPKGFEIAYTAENGAANPGVFCKQVPVYGIGGRLITTQLTNELVEIPHHPAHGAQPHGIVVHQGANYSLGTSTTQMHETSHAFRCAYRRGEEPHSPADYAEVLLRYNINDKIPGGRTVNTYWKSPEYADEKENYCYLYWDRGRHHGLQHGNTAMLLTVPNWSEYWDVRQMATELFVYKRAGMGRVCIGEMPVESLPTACAEEALITIDEGATYLAIFPLISRVREREAAIRLREVDEMLVISLINHEGASLELSPRDMAKLGGGCVFAARDAADYPSFAAFQAEMRGARLHDQLYGGVRRVHFATPALRLSMVLCPFTNTVMYRCVNGLDAVIPQFAYSDGRHAGLPFLDGTPRVGFEDWEWITTQIERDPETYNPID